MPTSLNTSSAKIFQFTPRKRDGAAQYRGFAQVVELRRSSPEIVYCPGAWYHDAAIAEDARSRKG